MGMDFQSTRLEWLGPAVEVDLFLSLSYYRRKKNKINETKGRKWPANQSLIVGVTHHVGSFSYSMNGIEYLLCAKYYPRCGGYRNYQLAPREFTVWVSKGLSASWGLVKLCYIRKKAGAGVKEPTGKKSQPRGKPGKSLPGVCGQRLEEWTGFHTWTLISVKLCPQKLRSIACLEICVLFLPRSTKQSMQL